MSHPDLKNHNSIFQVSRSRLTTLPAALACCYLAYNMRKGVPGSEWKGKRWFPCVRSGFAWFILSLLIVFKARPALMAQQCTHIHAGRWLSAHGKALPYFPLGYHCTKVSHHCCHCRHAVTRRLHGQLWWNGLGVTIWIWRWWALSRKSHNTNPSHSNINLNWFLCFITTTMV